jgi:hypothetical protein
LASNLLAFSAALITGAQAFLLNFIPSLFPPYPLNIPKAVSKRNRSGIKAQQIFILFFGCCSVVVALLFIFI